MQIFLKNKRNRNELNKMYSHTLEDSYTHKPLHMQKTIHKAYTEALIHRDQYPCAHTHTQKLHISVCTHTWKHTGTDTHIPK